MKQVNDLSAFSSFKNAITTLQEASKDTGNGTYMTNSQYEVLDFDEIKKLYANNHAINKHPSSADALSQDQNGSFIFVEFKNGEVDSKNINKKIYESTAIFMDITNTTISFTRKNMDYILVYNESKNPIKKNKQSITDITSHVSVKAKEYYPRFRLASFKDYFFRNIYTYTEKEFTDYLSKTTLGVHQAGTRRTDGKIWRRSLFRYRKRRGRRDAASDRRNQAYRFKPKNLL